MIIFTFLFLELEREIQEMSMVYDVAKHDTDSKDTLSRLITEMFRKGLRIFLIIKIINILNF